MLGLSRSPEIPDTNWPRQLVLWTSISILVFLSFWYLFDIILLAFAGSLVAIVLHTLSEFIQRHTPKIIGPKLSSTATIFGIIIAASLIGYWIVPRAIFEAGQISQVIPSSFNELTVNLDKTSWGSYLERAAHGEISAANVESKLSMLAAEVGTAVEGAVVIAVIGLYGTLNAREYSQGLLSLIVPQKRQMFAKVSHAVVYALRWWLIGQMVPMAVLGIATMICLWALGVPLAFTLGLLTGIMIFIPYIGSWIAFIPTVLVALTRGTATAIYVSFLFLVIHGVEGYILTPLVQKRVVLLPPVMTILAQLFMWKVSGIWGVALATPLAAVLLVLVKVLYLHEDIERNQSIV